MQNLVIIGLGNTAEHVYSFVTRRKLFNVIGFAVNECYISEPTFMGLNVFPIERLDQFVDKDNDLLYVALLWNRLNKERKDLYLNLKKRGWKFANLISPTAVVEGEIGDNCWIHDYSSIWYGSTIGDNVIIRPYVMIAEKCTIGDHSYFAPHAIVAGKCEVGEQTFVGLNATIFDTRKVGKKCIIGACTAVKRDVPDFTVVKTSPNTEILKQYTEDLVEDKLVHTKNVR